MKVLYNEYMLIFLEYTKYITGGTTTLEVPKPPAPVEEVKSDVIGLVTVNNLHTLDPLTG